MTDGRREGQNQEPDAQGRQEGQASQYQKPRPRRRRDPPGGPAEHPQAQGRGPCGQPPHTHTKRLPQAIKYAVEKKTGSVVIGPDVESFGTAGKAHEHGGQFRGERYPRRPFMGPALEKTKERLPKMWAGSVR